MTSAMTFLSASAVLGLASLAGCDNGLFGSMPVEFEDETAFSEPTFDPDPTTDPEPAPEAPVDDDLDNDGVLNEYDCDDDNPAVGGAKQWRNDNDGDGWGGNNGATYACVQPSKTVPIEKGGDCNDNDATVHPGAPEVCDGKDNDCEGVVDDATGNLWYVDADGDGYGALNKPVVNGCSGGSFLVANAEDCDDSDPNIRPGAQEVCAPDKLVDEDCDGLVDDADPSVDTDTMGTSYADGDDDGFGDFEKPHMACWAPKGNVKNADDCDDANNTILPSALELCNGLDDDCDGEIDEGLLYAVYPDNDGDLYGDDLAGLSYVCVTMIGQSSLSGDCDDSDDTIYPGAWEVCDGVDNDCNGAIDAQVVPQDLCDDGDPLTSDWCDGENGCVSTDLLFTVTCELPAAFDPEDGFVCAAAAFVEFETGAFGGIVLQDTPLTLPASDTCFLLGNGVAVHINACVYDPADPFCTWVGGEHIVVTDPNGDVVSGTPGTVTVFPGGLDFVFELEDVDICQ